MRKLLTLAVATLFASTSFANYDLATKAQKANSLDAEINYSYGDLTEKHNLGLDFEFGLMEGLEINLLMPVYTQDAVDEIVPSNPWLGVVYDVNEMFAVKAAANLAFIRDPKEMLFDLAVVYNMPIGDGMKFFAEIGIPMGTGYTFDGGDDFGLAIAVKPGIEYAVDQFMAQLYVDFQEAVMPTTEMYFGMALNLNYMINEENCVFLGSSMAFSGNKYVAESNWLMSGADDFNWTIMAGYKYTFAW